MSGGKHHQMGHDHERDAVYLAALTGIIANPGFFGPIHQGSPAAAADFASEAVSRVFRDADAAPADSDLLGALQGLVDVIRKAGVANLMAGVQLGQTSWGVKANDALQRADAAISRALGES